MDILIDLGISTILTLLKKIAKSDTERRKWKNVMLKISRAIETAYPDDNDFPHASE